MERILTLVGDYVEVSNTTETNETVKLFLECFTREEIINALAQQGAETGPQVGFYCYLFDIKSHDLCERMLNTARDLNNQMTVEGMQKNSQAWNRLNRQQDRLYDRFEKLEL